MFSFGRYLKDDLFLSPDRVQGHLPLDQVDQSKNNICKKALNLSCQDRRMLKAASSSGCPERGKGVDIIRRATDYQQKGMSST